MYPVPAKTDATQPAVRRTERVLKLTAVHMPAIPAKTALLSNIQRISFHQTVLAQCKDQVCLNNKDNWTTIGREEGYDRRLFLCLTAVITSKNTVSPHCNPPHRDVSSLSCLQVLRSDSLKLMERELFVYFLTDPPRLKRAIAELSARVDAQIVSLK